MISIKPKTIEIYCNAIELTGISVVLLLTLAIEFFLKESPCPLCLLQRVGLFLVAIGFLMNLRFTPHPRHYAMIILSGLFTAFVALRHIAINLTNPDGGFGSTFFGLHLYTWAFIVSMAIIIGATLIMSIERKYLPVRNNNTISPIAKVMLATTILLLLINIGTLIF